LTPFLQFAPLTVCMWWQ